MNGRTLSVWFYGEDVDAVRLHAKDILLAPFVGVEVVGSVGTDGWDNVKVGDIPVFVAISARTEQHVVLEVVARSDVAGVHHAFAAAFRAVMARVTPAVAECVFAKTHTDVYPWFTHSFHRSMPLTEITNVESDEHVTSVDLGTSEFWVEWGPRLHFVHSATLARVAGPDPAEYASRIAATVEQCRDGWLFHCEWPDGVDAPADV